MALTLKQFEQQLFASGLVSEAQLAALLEPLETPPTKPEKLAKLLIDEGLLTKFQAKLIAQGKGKSLTLDRYVIKDKIGAGGMGQVYLAEHARMKRQVAIKVLPPEMVKNADSVQRFHREVEAAAKLNHPNIVTAHDANEDKGTHFLVMEHVEGDDLSHLVKKNGPFSVELALDAIKQSASGLAYAHSRGVIHRDIKPANLLMDPTGTVKILDMGLARIDVTADSEAQAGLTNTGMVMGTVDYMAPEQAMDTRTADARSDIYSLGCTLFYLLTARPLFKGDTVMKKLMALQTEEAPSITSLRGGLSDDVERLYRKMTAKKASDRFQTMEEVVRAVEQCQTGVVTNAGDGVTQDSALLAFLEGQQIAEEQTLVGVTEPMVESDATQIDTTPSEVLGATMTSIRSKPTKAEKRGGGGFFANKKLLWGFGGGLAAILLLGIIIKITSSDGKVTTVEVPEGSQTKIDNDGNVDVTLPGKGENTAGNATTEPRNPQERLASIVPEAAAYARERRAAEWVLSKRGSIAIITPGLGTYSALSNRDELPREPFFILSVYLRDVDLSQEDLSLLNGLPKLRYLDVMRTGLTSKAIPAIATLPTLSQFLLSGAAITTSGLQQLRHLPSLGCLLIDHAQVDDQWEFLSALPAVRTLQVNVGKQLRDVSPDHFSRLQTLLLWSSNAAPIDASISLFVDRVLSKNPQLRMTTYSLESQNHNCSEKIVRLRRQQTWLNSMRR